MTSRSGGLLELVARGKKDVFFTANPVVSYIHSVYIRAAPFTKEIHTTKPRNAPEWGKWVDFDIDHRGDIVRQFYLRVDLPTWLPAVAAAANPSGIVTDSSGVTYGWTNNIGFQMIDKLQVFEDQVLIHELYGEQLEWRLRQSNPLATTLVLARQVGNRPETPLGIARSATFGQLRVPLAIIGWQHIDDPGFPTVALRAQRYKLRIWLRPLSSLIVASDRRIAPQPWGSVPLRVQATAMGGVDTSMVTLHKSAMNNLGLSLETTQLYLPTDVNLYLKSTVLRFPFMTAQFQQYTIEDNTMTAAFFSPAGSVNYPMAIDFIGSVSRLFLGFRTEANTQAGDLTNLRPPGSGVTAANQVGLIVPNFITSMRLNIANIDRVKSWPVAVFREVTSYWKSTRMALDLVDAGISEEIYSMTFGGYESGDPAGTLNFSRATNPMIYLILNGIPYDKRIVSRKTYALLYAESWNIFEISNGRGRCMFNDS